MKKLKVAFLWHQHQPYYKVENDFIMPWVLLHSTKDYYDMPEVLYEYPNIKQTFNFAPSLLLQIDEYIKGKAEGKILRLTRVPANKLDEDTKKDILNLFFQSNVENIISIYPRYFELYNKSRDYNYALYNFTENDWIDLQIWYNLSWMGYFSKQSPEIKRLIEQGSNFEEKDKEIVQNEQKNILKKIKYQYLKLRDLGQIEITSSPMYHPIMPLLISSEAVLESKPNQELPELIFKFPSDAELQLKRGLEYFENTFGDLPNGVWPSEGSVSDATLDIFIKNGIKWLATDEQILHNSVKYDAYLGTEKFFPRKYKNENGEIAVFFRDHFLSDRIGFVYSSWNAQDAANDFISHLASIRSEIIKNHGEDALEYACVSVILDGENCWEYYKDNGIPFLRALYGHLSNSDEFTTVTFSEALNNNSFGYLRDLNHIFAGSWINANFDIWLSDREEITAWNLLSKARHTLEEYKNKISAEKYNKALDYLLISEGSDWFWWYGPDHQTVNKPDFDKIFRYYIRKSYEEIGLEVPTELFLPVYGEHSDSLETLPNRKLENISKLSLLDDTNGLGKIVLISGMTSMHQIGDILDNLVYANDNEYLYLKIVLKEELKEDYSIKLNFPKNNLSFEIENYNYKGIVSGLIFQNNLNNIVFGLPLSYFDNNDYALFQIETDYRDSTLLYPKYDYYRAKIIR